VKIKRKVLVTTAIENEFCCLEDKVYLGKWCLPGVIDGYSNKNIVAYHWDDRDKLFHDYQYVGKLKKDLIYELGVYLNNKHSLQYDTKYWNIILGYWLNQCLSAVYDRWCMLHKAIDGNYFDCVFDYQYKIESLSSNDLNSFNLDIVSDKWNRNLYLYILNKYIDIEFDNIAGISTGSVVVQKRSPVVFTLFSKLTVNRVYGELKKRVLSLTSKIYGANDEFFFIADYMDSKLKRNLLTQLGQSNRAWISIKPPVFNWSASRLQDKMASKDNYPKNSFEYMIRDMLPCLLPRVIVEGFDWLSKKTNCMPWPEKPGVIFTANAHYNDVFFKKWAADKCSNGAKLFIAEHGGQGNAKFNGGMDVQLSISDKFFTTGWSGVSDKVCPVGNFRDLYANTQKYDKNGYAMLVCTNSARYSHDIRSKALSSQIIDYFEYQSIFFKSLSDSVKGSVRVRLYKEDYMWMHKKRWLYNFPGIMFDNHEKPIWSQFEMCRLIICTYNATTHLEALYKNIPTVIFWDESQWELNMDAELYFNLLEDVGIFHRSPESASRHISSIWSNIDDWWFDNETQKAVSNFVDYYYASVPDIANKFKEHFLS
jgi:putative transferase (TIGR04331 family)